MSLGFYARRFRALCLVLGFMTVSGHVSADEFRYAPAVVGKDTVAARCVVCHSIEQGGPPRYAPNLYGVVGDDKARKLGYFSYSSGLRNLGGTWTREDLDKYLSDPQGYIPGTKKSVAVTNAEERTKIIDFLVAQAE